MNPYEPVGWGGTGRSRVSRWLPALAVLGGVVVVGILGFGPNGAPNESGGVPSTPFPSSPAVGVVVEVESTGLSNVTGFWLDWGGFGRAHFAMGQLENAEGFSPSHLAEHQLTSEPVRVFFRFEDGVAVVYRLEDAPRS